jgi:hypothetical protein
VVARRRPLLAPLALQSSRLVHLHRTTLQPGVEVPRHRERGAERETVAGPATGFRFSFRSSGQPSHSSMTSRAWSLPPRQARSRRRRSRADQARCRHPPLLTRRLQKPTAPA